jgi:hypothetical protein
MHNNWTEGDNLDAASRRGDLIREMMRERGYTEPVSIIEDILASVAAEERRERAEWEERHRGDMHGRTLHTLSPQEAAATAVAQVEQIMEEPRPAAAVEADLRRAARKHLREKKATA